MAEQIQIVTPYGPTEALHWYLSDEEMMWAALKELVRDHGHRGVVMEWPDTSGAEQWQLEVNDANGNAATVRLGQHLVLAEKITAWDQAQYESLKHDEGEQ